MAQPAPLGDPAGWLWFSIDPPRTRILQPLPRESSPSPACRGRGAGGTSLTHTPREKHRGFSLPCNFHPLLLPARAQRRLSLGCEAAAPGCSPYAQHTRAHTHAPHTRYSPVAKQPEFPSPPCLCNAKSPSLPLDPPSSMGIRMQ